MGVSYFSRLLWKSHASLRRTEHVYMVLVSIVIGLLGGLAAVGIRELIHLGQVIAWNSETYTLDYIHNLPSWWKVLAPTFGGLIVGFIIHFFAKEAKGHGVPEVMEALALRGGRIRPRVAIAKMFASAVCIASGGSAGREGPIVQIGSSLGSTIGQWLGVGERRVRTLVGCGAAAGIAGAFNAPVAGALFAVEIILGDFAVTQFSPIVISSVVATVVSHAFEGDFPAFDIPTKYSLESPNELFAYALMGLMAGLAALALIKVLYSCEDFFEGLKIYPPIKPAIGGAIIGIIALWYPEIFGVGYEAINEALAGQMLWSLLLILALVKIVAVSVTLGSGGSGGVFAPSLFIGAMVGGAIGTVVESFWPGATGGPGAYALVGMGAVVAAGTHAPITAIIIIFELTNDYQIILPLMISCIIATLLSTRLSKSSIYTLKLRRRGIYLDEGQTVNILRDLKVNKVMRSDIATVGPDEPLTGIISQFIEHPGNTLFVVDEEKHLLGTITIDQIRPVMSDPSSFQFLLIASDIMEEKGFPVIGKEDTLDEVMQILGNYRFETAVIEDGRLVGTVLPEDVIKQYNKELFKREMASGMASALAGPPATVESIPGLTGISMGEIPVPPRFVGKTLKELDLRNRHEVTVVLIRRHVEGSPELTTITPTANENFQAGDLLVAIGPPDKLHYLEHG